MTQRTLKVTVLGFGIAREGGLRLLVLQGIEDLSVGDVADLEVLLDQLASLVAHSALVVWHHGVASIVGLTDITVDARPAFFALAFPCTASWGPVLAIRQSTTQGLRTVFATKSRTAVTSSICFAAVGELLALEVLEVAVEAWRAAVGPIAVDGEE